MGIAEQDMMSTAAGLATCGKIPYASTFAIFAAGRAYDQIRNSISYPKLNVKICATHAGITVGEDGATHQMIEDISLMRTIPNMTVISVSDDTQTKWAVKEISKIEGPDKHGFLIEKYIYFPFNHKCHFTALNHYIRDAILKHSLGNNQVSVSIENQLIIKFSTTILSTNIEHYFMSSFFSQNISLLFFIPLKKSIFAL